MIRIFLLLFLWIFFAEGSIIKKPPVKLTDVAYKDLVCTEQEQRHIHEIISTVAETTAISLGLFKRDHLRELETRIAHVHPLKFLSVIFCDPYLKSCMPLIWSDIFKQPNFMSGLRPALDREAGKGKLHHHIRDFAEELNVSAEPLFAHVELRDWEGLVIHLMNVK